MVCVAGLALIEKSPAGAVTLTVADPETPLAAAVTVNGPPVVEPAVNSPDWEIVPPVAVHANDGWTDSGRPNWSSARAANCWLAPTASDVLVGETAIDVRTGAASEQ